MHSFVCIPSIRNSPRPSFLFIYYHYLFSSLELHNTMKNGSKNKFLTCFRPEPVDIDAGRSSSRRFSCIPVADHKHDENKFLEQENWVVLHPPKRKLSKVIKALVFETILSKRARYKNYLGQDCFGSKRSYSEYSEISSIDDHEKSTLRLESAESTNIKGIKARELLLLSSSSPSSPLPKSKDLSNYDNSKEQLEKEKMFECVGIFLALMSLAVTVFWGKWKAIILTSMWLCFFSLLVASYRRVKEVAKGNHNGGAGPKKQHQIK